MAVIQELLAMLNSYSWTLLCSPLCLRGVLPVRVPYMGQIEIVFGFDTKLHLIVRLQFKLFWQLWIPIHGHYPQSTLFWRVTTCLGTIYGSNRTSVLGMTLNYIWSWGSNSRTFVNVEYITSRSTKTQWVIIY